MTLLGNIVGNIIALLTLLFSAQVSVGWGEVGSYDVHGDKSGLSGLGMLPVVMVIRWLAIALLLVIAVGRGSFDFLPGGRWQQGSIVVGVHLALGYLAYRTLDGMTNAIHRSDASPLGWAWIFGLALPIVVLLVAVWGVNARWLPRRPAWGVAIALLVVWAHVAAWRQGYRRPSSTETNGTTAPSR